MESICRSSLFTAAALSVRQTEKILKLTLSVEVSHEEKDKLHLLYLVFNHSSDHALYLDSFTVSITYWKMC